jgi:hypothetical protein
VKLFTFGTFDFYVWKTAATAENGLTQPPSDISQNSQIIINWFQNTHALVGKIKQSCCAVDDSAEMNIGLTGTISSKSVMDR